MRGLRLHRQATGLYTMGIYTIRLLEQTATTWQILEGWRVVAHTERLMDAKDWVRRKMGGHR